VQDLIGVFALEVFGDVIEIREVDTPVRNRKPQTDRDSFQLNVPMRFKARPGLGQHLLRYVDADRLPTGRGDPLEQPPESAPDFQDDIRWSHEREQEVRCVSKAGGVERPLGTKPA
jgi:hypothetical protein